jgi:hypothetical protein
MNLALRSSLGFREKLAEREEAILVHWRQEKTDLSSALIKKSS